MTQDSKIVKIHPAARLSLTEPSQHLQKRLRAEKRFRFYGLISVAIALCIVSGLISIIGYYAHTALQQTQITLDITLDTSILDEDGNYAKSNDILDLKNSDWQSLALIALEQLFPDATDGAAKREIGKMLSRGAGEAIWDYAQKNPNALGKTITLSLPASSDVDMLQKGFIDKYAPSDTRRLNDAQLTRIQFLQDRGLLRAVWNFGFLQSVDSREPELAGIWSGLMGSIWTMIITILFALPIAVCAAIYLQEFAKQSRLTRFIEVTINNLAAVPSIIFGLLGLAVFLKFFGMPRSTPIVGGLVLGLMTLPVIIVASRSALGAIPHSIRDAALALGASRIQAVFHHILPLAIPGIMTGAIIGMARAIGETAPLLMIGMVAFIATAPSGITSPATVLPVQIFMWAQSPERGFVEKTAAAIVVLLIFLLMMNMAALYIRHKFEKKF